MSNFVPEGWLLSEAEELYSRMRVPQVYDRNLVDQSGKYPVLDQSENGCVGYLNSKPEFECSSSSPLTTFANHTCAVRQMTRSFGVIQNVFPLKAKAHVSQEFLFQILKGAIPQNGYKGHYPDLREKLFLTPPLPEQQKIATILSSVDDVIEKTRAQINKLKDLKTGMMQELLTKGIGHTEFKDSSVGRIPNEWELKPLSTLVCQKSPICYGILMPGKHVVGGVPVIKVRDIRGGVINEGNLLLTSKEIDDKYTRSRVKTGDILLTIRGTTGRTAVVQPSLDSANITQDTARVRVENDQLARYILVYLQSPLAQIQIEAHTIGQAVKGINLEEVRKLCIALPPESERNAIASTMFELDRKIMLITTKLATQINLKKALIQDLLTGKVRVKLTDKESAVV